MEYLFVLLVLIWVLSQLMGQQSDEQTSQAPPQAPERDQSRSASDQERPQSVQDAIREIEQQLQGGSRQESEDEGAHHWEQRKPSGRPRSTSGAEPRTPARSSRHKPAAAGRQRRRPEGRPSDGRRSQVESPDVKDVTFENEISTPPSFEAPGSRAPRPGQSQEPEMQSRIRKRLESHEGRREAFLIKELIDRPRSQRPWPG